MEVTCVLIPDFALADPVEAGELTEGLLRRLERIGAAGGGEPDRDDAAAGDRGAGRPRGALPRPHRRSLRAGRVGGAAARPWRRRAAAPAPPARGVGRAARAAGRGRRWPARARPEAA